MRRKDREVKDPLVIEDILQKNNLVRVAWVIGGKPYLLPLHYGYVPGRLYLHSAREGRKIEATKQAPEVCFEVSDSIEILPAETACGYTTRYRSVIGYGKIHIVEEVEEKRFGLSVLMRQITGREDWNIPEQALERVAVLRMDIIEVTGKQSHSY